MILNTVHNVLAPKDAQDSNYSKVIVASTKYSIKALSKAVTKTFKINF